MSPFRLAVIAFVLIIVVAGIYAVGVYGVDGADESENWACTLWVNAPTPAGQAEGECLQWTYNADAQDGVALPPFAAAGDNKGRARGQARRSRAEQ